MKTTNVKNGTALTVFAEGRIDSTTAPQFEKDVTGELAGVTALTLDFEKVEYVSSAGLRVILSLQKTMMKQGSMKLCNVNDTLMEIFDVTGFTDILTIE